MGIARSMRVRFKDDSQERVFLEFNPVIQEVLVNPSSTSHARSVRALARKRQITARLRKGLAFQGSSLPSGLNSG
jgi:hypothetical protein